MEKPLVTFILSVDTEEEWDWSGPFPNDNFSVQNIHEIPAFQLFCQELGIKPTYLIDYAVANNDNSVQILNALNKNECEFGAHLHPWANPPFFDETSEFSSHVINLPIEHVDAKLKTLIDVMQQKLHCQPRSFRTGRWGINGEVLNLIQQHGITTDSSVYPLYHHTYFSCEQAPNQSYWPSYNNTNNASEQRDILEIPVTCGFNRSYYGLAQKIHKYSALSPLSHLRINGLLWHSRLLRKLYLSPELCSANDMKRLVDTCFKRGEHTFHMYLHSSSFLEQVTGLNDELNARENICQRIAQVIKHIQTYANVEFLTLSEAHEKFKKNN